jgi:hypothetical protein
VCADDSNCPRAIKGLPAKLQRKIESFVEDDPQLPAWHEEIRGVPNICLRSALFGVIQRGRRKAVKGEQIASVGGLYIRYTGWRLDQGDFDVLAHAFHLLSRQQEKSRSGYVPLSAKGFLRGIGRQWGKSGRNWLLDSFRRMNASAVEIRLEVRGGIMAESYTYAGSLIEEFYYDEGEGTYLLKINQKLCSLFDSGWTMLQWKQRILLQTDLAKWLHGFYASHATPYPMKVATLKYLCGSECGRLSDYRGKLRAALDELVKYGVLDSWKIDRQDKVQVQKKVSHQ